MNIGTTWAGVEGLLRDLRQAARGLRRQPGFALTAVVTLALATGPNTAIFSLLDSVLLRPLPVHEPARLLDPRLPLSARKTLVERLAVPLLPTRLAAAVLATLGVLALGLAAVGIYGVASYAVSRRSREIGVRMALGATHANVVRLVLGDGLRHAAVGLGLGLALALLAARLIERFLFGVSASDVATYSAVGLLLMAVAALANYLPARRAAATDPLIALRCE